MEWVCTVTWQGNFSKSESASLSLFRKTHCSFIVVVSSLLTCLRLDEETYQVNEKILAWDRGNIYEAKVLKCKEDNETGGGRKYLVHYQ